MSTTVYSVPKKIAVPFTDFANYNRAKAIAQDEAYIEKVRNYVKQFSTSKYNGKIARFAVADGYAEYMVISIKPCELIHLPMGDAYQFHFIERLTGKDISTKIDGQESLAKIFSK